jgi:hypothetical protein
MESQRSQTSQAKRVIDPWFFLAKEGRAKSSILDPFGFSRPVFEAQKTQNRQGRDKAGESGQEIEGVKAAKPS